MKFKFNIFLLLAVICSFRSIESRTHGSNTDVSKYELVKQDLKYKPDRTATPDMSNKLQGSKVFTSPLKQSVKHKVYSNPLSVKNRNYADQTTFHDTLVINKPKSNIPSINVGEHEIKVSSILHTKHMDIKSKDGVKEISVNPKFSHIIEILSRKEPSTLTDKELGHTKIPEVSEGEMVESFTERLNFESNIKGVGNEEANTEQWSGNLIETGKIPTSDLEEEKLELPNEENSKLPRDQLSEISTTLPTNSGEISESTINTETTDSGSRSGQDEFLFRDEFEGSGEEFSFDNVASRDQNAPKDGRLLNLISQGTNSSACTTPKGESGQCRRIRECLLSDTLNNFNVFLRQLCLIRGVLVGVCCPDNPVIETTNTEESTTEANVDENIIEQPPEGCGLNTKTRIVGGTISAPHEWTWMVALLRRNRFYCGGVIINNWYILTAAHCILGMDVKDLTVRLGEYDFNDDSKQKEDISVAEIKRHAQFVTLTFQHDIALLKLQRRIRYSKFVGSICLPTKTARDYSDVNGTVVGWGTVSFGGAASPILRQVTVPVWKNEDCDRTYFLEKINDAFLCAGSPEKGEDACQGDSGGPLMTLNEGGRWEVIGIVSWGRRCGDPTYPGVYTRVTTYMDWILQNID